MLSLNLKILLFILTLRPNILVLEGVIAILVAIRNPIMVLLGDVPLVLGMKGETVVVLVSYSVRLIETLLVLLHLHI